MSLMFAKHNPNLTCLQVDDESAYHPICQEEYSYGWCKNTIANISEFYALGIQDFSEISFTLYPNLVQKNLYIDSIEPINSIYIYSIYGNLIKETSTTHNIDVLDLDSGLYLGKVSIGARTAIKKFIKI